VSATLIVDSGNIFTGTPGMAFGKKTDKHPCIKRA
jgi:hypothetical protein